MGKDNAPGPRVTRAAYIDFIADRNGNYSMSYVHNIIRRSGAFFAGILLGLAGVTPVFAATLDGQLTPRNLILVVSLVLLAVGIAMKLMQRRRHFDEGGGDSPDLRWWMN
jgi:hypothetical protein